MRATDDAMKCYLFLPYARSCPELPKPGQDILKGDRRQLMH
jgi:hypothetical protein